MRKKNVKQAKISMALVDDAAISKVNKQYFDRKNTTDIIAFNLNEQLPEHTYLLGELVISLPQIARQAKKYHVSVAEELARVTAHGVLHLMGYEDDADDKKAEMKRIEDKIVNALENKETR